MPTIDFDIAKKHVISILQASRTAYGVGTTGNTPDGTKRQFASATEIADTILEVDGEICKEIITAPGHPYSAAFEITPTAIQNGADIPARNGMITKVQISEDNVSYSDGKKANSYADIQEMREYPARFGGSSATLGWWITVGRKFFTTSLWGKVNQTDYTKTSVPQAPENYIWAVVSGTVGKLLKDGGDTEMAAYYSGMYAQAKAEIKQGVMEIPPVNQYQ
jgi:hypothetical protein